MFTGECHSVRGESSVLSFQGAGVGHGYLWYQVPSRGWVCPVLGLFCRGITTSRREKSSNEYLMSLVYQMSTPIINNIQFPSRCLGDNTSNKYFNLKCCLCFDGRHLMVSEIDEPSPAYRGNLLELQDKKSTC